MKNGTLVFPVQTAHKNGIGATIMYSNDSGKTWQMPKTENVLAPNQSSLENMAFETEEGNIVLTGRGNNRWAYITEDMGITWKPYNPINGFSGTSAQPSQGSSIYVTLPSGKKVLLVSKPNGNRDGYSRGNIALWALDAKNPNNKHQIAIIRPGSGNARGAGYSSLAYKDGKLLVAYEDNGDISLKNLSSFIPDIEAKATEWQLLDKRNEMKNEVNSMKYLSDTRKEEFNLQIDNSSQTALTTANVLNNKLKLLYELKEDLKKNKLKDNVSKEDLIEFITKIEEIENYINSDGIVYKEVEKKANELNLNINNAFKFLKNKTFDKNYNKLFFEYTDLENKQYKRANNGKFYEKDKVNNGGNLIIEKNNKKYIKISGDFYELDSENNKTLIKADLSIKKDLENEYIKILDKGKEFSELKYSIINYNGTNEKIILSNLKDNIENITNDTTPLTKPINFNQIKSNALTVSDAYNLGYNIYKNNDFKGIVKATDNVKFIDGINTEVNIEKKNNNYSIKFDLTNEILLENNGFINFKNSNVKLSSNGLNNGGNKITNVADATEDKDVVNLSQLSKYIKKEEVENRLIDKNLSNINELTLEDAKDFSNKISKNSNFENPKDILTTDKKVKEYVDKKLDNKLDKYVFEEFKQNSNILTSKIGKGDFEENSGNGEKTVTANKVKEYVNENLDMKLDKNLDNLTDEVKEKIVNKLTKDSNINSDEITILNNHQIRRYINYKNENLEINIKENKLDIIKNNNMIEINSYGISNATAIANLPTVSNKFKHRISFAIGYFNKKSSIAVGVNGYLDNENKISYKTSLAGNTSGVFSIGAGISYDIGNKIISKVKYDELNDKIKNLELEKIKLENEILKNRIKDLEFKNK